MMTSVRIEHSADTLISRSSGLDVLKVAERIFCSPSGPTVWTCEPAATALLAGWALLVVAPRAIGTAMAIVPARPAAMTTRGENRGMPAPSLRAGTKGWRAQVWTRWRDNSKWSRTFLLAPTRNSLRNHRRTQRDDAPRRTGRVLLVEAGCLARRAMGGRRGRQGRRQDLRVPRLRRRSQPGRRPQVRAHGR